MQRLTIGAQRADQYRRMLPDTIHEAIKDLRQELERIEYAIRQIEAVEQGKTLRGRPPKHVSATNSRDTPSSRA